MANKKERWWFNRKDARQFRKICNETIRELCEVRPHIESAAFLVRSNLRRYLAQREREHVQEINGRGSTD